MEGIGNVLRGDDGRLSLKGELGTVISMARQITGKESEEKDVINKPSWGGGFFPRKLQAWRIVSQGFVQNEGDRSKKQLEGRRR